MPMTQTDLFSLMRDTVDIFWGQNYEKVQEANSTWKRYLLEKKTKFAWSEIQELAGPGLLQPKEHGANIALDTVMDGTSVRLTVRTMALRLGIAEEVIEDAVETGDYSKAKDWNAWLMDVAEKTIEYDAANLLNRAFNSSFTGADGVSLCSPSHLITKGGTYDNTISAATLAPTSLETMAAVARRQKNAAGLIQGFKLVKIAIPPELEWRAKRIVKSDQQADTANNDYNAIGKSGIEVVVVPYMTSTTNWFGITNSPTGMYRITRVRDKMRQEMDPIAGVLYVMVRHRDVFGWADPRYIIGSNS